MFHGHYKAIEVLVVFKLWVHTLHFLSQVPFSF